MTVSTTRSLPTAPAPTCPAGLDDLTEGQVWLGDVELGGPPDRDRTLVRRTRIGVVFPAFDLVPTLTARENTELPLTLAGRRADLTASPVLDRVWLRRRRLGG